MVDVIKTGFSAEWMPAGEMEGRRARCLATAKKSAFPAVIPIREKMIHIERRTPEADDPQYRCFRGSVCFEVSCVFSGGRGKENDHAHIFYRKKRMFCLLRRQKVSGWNIPYYTISADFEDFIRSF